MESLPTRGAWIEIGSDGRSSQQMASLPTRGAWIEIRRRGRRSRWRSRSPRGERGLKFWELDLVDVSAAVAPHAGSVD